MCYLRFYLTALLLVLCTSCIEETDRPLAFSPSGGEETEQPVAVSFMIPEEEGAVSAATRAVGQSALKPGETLRIVVYRNGQLNEGGFVAENCYLVEAGTPHTLKPCTVDNKGMVIGEGKDMFLIPGNAYDIYAYSPAYGLDSDHKTIGGIAHGEDFLLSKKTLTLQKFTPISLDVLQHKCALVELKIVNDPNDPSVISLTGKKVVLKKIAASPASYILGTVGVVSPASMTEDVEITSFNQVNDLEFTAAQVVLPKPVGKFDIGLTVLINGQEYELAAPDINLALEGGNRYTWTITCKRKGVTLTFSVASWGNERDDYKVGVPAPLQKPANSYLVKPGLGATFEMKYPDGTSLLNTAGIVRAGLVWQTKDGGNLVIGSNDNVVWDATEQRIRVYSNTAALNGGRALVAAYDSSGQIVYSWLIWVTPYDPSRALEGTVKTTNQTITNRIAAGAVHTYDTHFLTVNGSQSVMMDRNLGATSVMDAGCYFQNGRKDAFVAVGQQLFKADGTAFTQPTPVNSNATPNDALLNPTTLYTQYYATAWTQINAGSTPMTGAKSNNDPCPYGWRVPYTTASSSSWNAFTTSTFGTVSGGRQYGIAGGNAQYPTAGYWSTGGAFVTGSGRYWGASRNGSAGYGLFFDSSTVTTSGSDQASAAASLRCVQDAIEFPFGIPTLEPVTVTEVTSNAARFNGTLRSNAGAAISEYGFCYGTSKSTNGAGTKVQATNLAASGAFYLTQGSLAQGTTFYVQAYVRTSAGLVVYTPFVEFTPLGAPAATTIDAIAGGPNTGTVKGRVDNTGGDANVERGILYSVTPGFNPVNQGTKMKASSTGIGEYSVGIAGLKPGTTYYARAYVTNVLATTYGMQRSFTTNSGPKLSEPLISGISGMVAHFSSELLSPNPPGVTAWGFEYSQSAEFPVGSATTVVNVSGPYSLGLFALNVTKLTSGSTYYVRSFAVNTAGKGYSPAAKFATLQTPKVRTIAVTGAVQLSSENKVPAVFNGVIDAVGTTYLLDRGFEYSETPGFAGGSGNKLSAGSGGFNAGTFALSTHFMKDNTIYYVRAYAENSAGMVYGDIVQTKFIYIPPNLTAISVSATDPEVGTIRFRKGGSLNAGNGEIIEQGFVYNEKGSTEKHYFSTTSNECLPRLKVFKAYEVRAYVKTVKGIYQSDAVAENTTYKNYFKWEETGQEYVLSTMDSEVNEWWCRGIGSLTLSYVGGDDGYYNTQRLMDKDAPGMRFSAAKVCWDRAPVNGKRWFLPSSREMRTAIYTTTTWPGYQHYSSEYKYREGGSFWSSEEAASMTAWLVDYKVNGGLLEPAYAWIIGKNDPRTIRCLRHRVLPQDEYAE